MKHKSPLPLFKLGIAFLIIATSSISLTQAQETLANRDRAKLFQDDNGESGLGAWGVRILHTTSYDDYHQLDGSGVTIDTFDVDNFMAQLDELETITHVMVNVSRGHQATWHSAPWPEKEGVPSLREYMQDDNGVDYFFPTRDLLGELLDAIQARGLKTIVYYSRYGFDESYMTNAGNLNAGASYDGAWDNWMDWINDATGTSNVYVGAAALLERYAEHYGDRIDGWWIDRCYSTSAADEARFAAAGRAGNPNAIVTMHTGSTGFVIQGTPECDYTGGHPKAMAQQVPWTSKEDSVNSNNGRADGRSGYDMVETIESGPYLVSSGSSSTASDSQNAALGHIFMPFQSQWRDGSEFPQDVLEEFTRRTVAAGGLYTWAVERVGSGFKTSRQNQLIALDNYIKSQFPTLGPGDVEEVIISNWDFNEGSGITAADISSGFDADVLDAAWSTDGVFGGALNFDGDDVVDVPPAAFNGIVNSDEVSIAVWVDGGNGTVFRATDANGRVLSATFNSNGKLYWDAGNEGTSNYDRISKTIDPSDHSGAWSHWIFTKNAASGDMKIYRNGSLWHSGTGKTRTIDSVTGGYIGAANASGANGFVGSIDDVWIYNTSFSDSQAAALYDETRSSFAVGHWALDEDDGVTAFDSSGNDYDGTVMAGAWVPGVSGSAIDFDPPLTEESTATEVSLPISSLDNTLATNAVTITAWVKGSTGAVFRANDYDIDTDTTSRVLNVIFNSNGKLYWDAGNSGTTSYDRIFKTLAPSEHSTTEWSHWAFTKDASSGSMAIYRNGELWHSGSGKTRTIDIVTSAYIGSSGAANYFDGSIDDVRLYSKALNANEIAALFTNYNIGGVPITWLSYYNIPITSRAEIEDSDLDGVSNMAEYALGGDPMDPENRGHATRMGHMVEDENTWFEFVYPRRKSSGAKLNYLLQSSTTLDDDWIPASYVEDPNPVDIDSEFEEITSRIEMGGKDKEFIRLSIEEK